MTALNFKPFKPKSFGASMCKCVSVCAKLVDSQSRMRDDCAVLKLRDKVRVSVRRARGNPLAISRYALKLYTENMTCVV